MILLAIPYHENKRYCLDKIVDWVDNASLPDTEIVMRWHKGTFGEPDAVKKQREFFRKLAIDIGASHLMFVGADTIPPLDALPRLLVHNVPYVSGLYYSRNIEGKNTAIAWVNGDDQQTFLDNKGLTEVDGVGNDCILISRGVFTQFSYLDWVQSDDDYPVCNLLKEKGYKIYLDTSIICKHYSTADTYSGQ